MYHWGRKRGVADDSGAALLPQGGIKSVQPDGKGVGAAERKQGELSGAVDAQQHIDPAAAEVDGKLHGRIGRPREVEESDLIIFARADGGEQLLAG